MLCAASHCAVLGVLLCRAHVKVVTELLDYGASVDAVDSHGQTALGAAYEGLQVS